jgi:predicted hydrocarbon binding protein
MEGMQLGLKQLCHVDERSEADGITLELDIYGESNPELETTNIYSWQLMLQGNTEFCYLSSVNVVFTFDKIDRSQLLFGHYVPQPKTAEVGSLQLSTPFQQIISFTETIEKDKIICEKGADIIKWEFRDINLTKNNRSRINIGGAVEVKFLPPAQDKKFKLYMEVSPQFNKICRQIVRRRMVPCQNPISISSSKVLEVCEFITPFDPKIGPLSESGKERILQYHYNIEDGVLMKGGIRNVSLRAETLSRLFDKIRRDVEGSEDVIRGAGKEIGGNFISEFINKIYPKNVPLNEKISAWIDYDSSAGMGKFEIDAELDHIKVFSSFNAYSSHDEPSSHDGPACYFLAGYFEGVLSQLLDESISVNETKCIASGSEYCFFEIHKKKRAYAKKKSKRRSK